MDKDKTIQIAERDSQIQVVDQKKRILMVPKNSGVLSKNDQLEMAEKKFKK
jgi:hypothetical protein